MKPSLEIYWSFRSPYSWLAIDRLLEIERDYFLDVTWRLVRPLAMREPDFFQTARPQFLPYLIMDALREGARLGIPVSMPNPDPIVMDMKTGRVADEQPYMPQLMGLGLAADRMGRCGLFARAVASRIWTGQDWKSDDALGEAAREAGLVLSDMQDWVQAHQDCIARTTIENEAAQMRSHWGVPLMVLDGEVFFGQDRIRALRWRLDSRKLRK